MFDFLTNNSGIFVLVLGALVAALGFWIFSLQRKLADREAHHDQLIQAVEEEGIEGVLSRQAKDITRLSHDAKELYEVTERMQEQVATSLSNVSVLRFNPFNDAGGNQSFSCAMLDERGNGLVISSLHHRSGNRMYAKPLKEGVSEFPLSREEKQTIMHALES